MAAVAPRTAFWTMMGALAVVACSSRPVPGEPCAPGDEPIVVDPGCTIGGGTCLLSCTGAPGCDGEPSLAWAASGYGPFVVVCGCDGLEHQSPNADYGGPPNVPFRWWGSCTDPCGSAYYYDGRWETFAPYPVAPFCTQCEGATQTESGCTGPDGMPRAPQCCECHYEGDVCVSVDGALLGTDCCEAQCPVERCYTGPIGTQDVGACRAGSSTCHRACEGEILPAHELAADGVDQDCDGSVDEGPEMGSIDPALAFDGEQYAAVWVEQYGRLAFARFDSEGTRSSYSEPLATSVVADAQIAWSGEHFGVLGGTSSRTFVFARLSRDGSLLEEHAFATRSCASTANLHRDAGRFYRLASPDHSGGTAHLFVARDGEAPQIVAIPEIPSASACGDLQDAAWNGAGYGVVWVREDELRFARLHADGALVTGSERSVSRVPVQSSVHLEWTGSRYVVLAGSGRELLELDPIGEIVRRRPLDARSAQHVSPFVRFADGALWYAWAIRAAVCGVAESTEAGLTSYDLVTADPDVRWHPGHLALGTSEVGLAFTMCPSGACEVYFTRLSSAGPTLPPVRISND